MSETKKMMGALAFTWVMMAGALGYMIWDKKQTPQHEATNASADELLAVQAEQQALSNQFKAVTELYDKQFQQIAEHDEQVVASIRQLDHTLNAGASTWALAQIQHYIEQAIVESDLLKNPELAVQFLDIADLQLQRMNNPNFLPLRQAIAKDKQMLTSEVSTTRENVILALNALVDVLPTVKQRTELLTPLVPKEPETKIEPMTWKEHVLASLSELKSLVVVRHHNDTIEPYFSPNEAAVLNENIQLMLLQAAYAASTGNQTLYENHLEMAIAWFNRYYDIHSPVGKKLLNTLTDLKDKTIVAQNMGQFASVDAWRQLLDEPKAAPTPSPAPEAKGGA